MATTELSPRRRVHDRWLPAGLWRLWLYSYAGIWIVTLVLAAGAAVGPVGVRAFVRHLLGLSLQPDPEPHVGHVFALAGHNIPVVSWPLLLGVIGAHRSRLGRSVADVAVTAYVFANTLPVGAALGAYGMFVVPYIPQLPLEWGGLALGASAWITQRHRALKRTEALGIIALILLIMFFAAVLETVAVPHR